MSRTQDDYAVTPKTDSPPEPADPSNPDHAARRSLPLAPPSVKPDSLRDRLTDDERPVTVDEAREEYLYVERCARDIEGHTSKHKRHLRKYAQLLESDRELQERYSGLTTAMLTRRLSPLDDSGEWLTPWECDAMLHGGRIRRRVRTCLNYQLGGYDFEYVAVTAPTTSAGTPHEHIYLWIDDPEDSVTTAELSPALDKHLSNCANAYERHHRFRTDGSAGAIRVEHAPPVRGDAPERFSEIREWSETEPRPVTQGAQYLASQLAHLPVGDVYNPAEPNPPDALLEGAALAWASPNKWFRASKGVYG